MWGEEIDHACGSLAWPIRRSFSVTPKRLRREQFLEEMDAVMPWAELLALAKPYYSK